jgi:peptidoglycan hydrolase CwlO-like protein
MYKKIITVFVVALLAISLPQKTVAANVVNTEKTTTNNSEAEKARSTVLLNRLNEIKAMDKSNLTSSEKKELRTELKSLKKEMRKSTSGVYLSVGAIIIIILLLILLV